MTTRQKLIVAASNEFALRGYDRVSLEDIAAAVGIKPPSIFKHFAGKKALYEAVLCEIRATLSFPNERFMKRSDGPIEVIASVWEYYWDWCEKNPSYAALLYREAFDTANPRIDQLRIASEYTVGLARAYIQHAQEAGQIRQFDPDSHIFWALSYPLSFFAVPGVRTSLWQGVRAKSSARQAKASFLEDAKHFLEPK